LDPRIPEVVSPSRSCSDVDIHLDIDVATLVVVKTCSASLIDHLRRSPAHSPSQLT
jgi:hypothetical protein